MNVSDSERIAKVLKNIGFLESNSLEDANLIIINICSIRQSAIDRVNGKIKSLSISVPHPSLNKNRKILLTGCILKKDKINLRKHCNGIFKIDELIKLPSLLKRLGFKIKKNDTEKNKHYLQVAAEHQSNITAYVPIMTGCNNFCAYCVVPYVRGPEISRPADDILCEIKSLVKRGVKEVWLLGQNVNSYSLTSANTRTGNDFAKLLKMVNDIEGNFWIRFTSSHPKDLSREMIEVFAKSDKLTPYFNLPIQSGSDEILKLMNRPYSVKKYKNLIKQTRDAFKKYRKGIEKEIAISTDVIVGFPGETKKYFKDTIKTFENINVAFAYISRYSPRSETAAFKLKDNVSHSEKKQREKRLLEIIEKSALKFNKKFLNKKVDVLVLKKQKDFYLGKTRHYQTIRFLNDNENKIGEFVKVKVTKIAPYGLEGKIQ